MLNKFLIEKKLAYIFFASAFIFINFLDQNFGRYFNKVSLLISYSIIFSFAILVYKLMQLFLKNTKSSLEVLTGYGIFIIFTYSYICDEAYTPLLNKISLFQKIPFSILWAFLAGSMLLLLYSLLKKPAFVIFSKNIIVFSFIFQSGSYAYHEFWYGNLNNATIKAKSLGTFQHKPNVYFFLVDGYPSTETLKEVLGFNNQGFEQALEKKGFYNILESHSNYHFTLASVSSQLMGEYHSISSDSFVPAKVFSAMIAGKNNIVKTFRDNGYKFIFAPSNIYSEFESQGLEDISVQSHFNFDILSTILNRTILRKYTPIIFKENYLEPRRVAQFLKSEKIKGPTFLYAHFMQVHDLMITKNGRKISGYSSVIHGPQSKNYLIESITDMNKKLLELMDSIIETDPTAVIIINSDHGICVGGKNHQSQEEADKFWNGWAQDGKSLSHNQLRYRFRNFIALRIPEKYISEKQSSQMGDLRTLTNINIFSFVFSCLGLKERKHLENKMILLDYHEKEKGYYHKEDVTSKLNQ